MGSCGPENDTTSHLQALHSTFTTQMEAFAQNQSSPFAPFQLQACWVSARSISTLVHSPHPSFFFVQSSLCLSVCLYRNPMSMNDDRPFFLHPSPLPLCHDDWLHLLFCLFATFSVIYQGSSVEWGERGLCGNLSTTKSNQLGSIPFSKPLPLLSNSERGR